jgi:hypothetical protein
MIGLNHKRAVLALSVTLCVAGCEPTGWFDRDMGDAEAAPAIAVAHAEVKPTAEPGGDTTPPSDDPTAWLDAELRALSATMDGMDARTDHPRDPISNPNPATETPPFAARAPAADPNPAPVPEEEEKAADPTHTPGYVTIISSKSLGNDKSPSTPSRSMLPGRAAPRESGPEPWTLDPEILETPEGRYIATIAREMAALRQDVDRMRLRFDQTQGSRVNSLQQENERLRREVRRMYALRQQNGGSLPMLPERDSDLFSGLAEDAYGSRADSRRFDRPLPPFSTAPPAPTGAPPPRSVAPNAPADPIALVGSSDSQYAVIAEWGRTPEAAVTAGTKVMSLRGMICVVPSGTSESDLTALARNLRQELAQYDNINIQIFDSAEAATAYSKTNSTEKGAPVLHISKFKASGEDTITLFRSGVAIPIANE